MTKPIDSHESHFKKRFKNPHDAFMNHEEATHLAKKHWKRNRNKYLRRQGKVMCSNPEWSEEEDDDVRDFSKEENQGQENEEIEEGCKGHRHARPDAEDENPGFRFA